MPVCEWNTEVLSFFYDILKFLFCPMHTAIAMLMLVWYFILVNTQVAAESPWQCLYKA